MGTGFKKISRGFLTEEEKEKYKMDNEGAFKIM